MARSRWASVWPRAPDPAFNSELLAADASFHVTLDEPGDYSFFCELHPSMQASIRVE